jgi:hypothetical protein
VNIILFVSLFVVLCAINNLFSDFYRFHVIRKMCVNVYYTNYHVLCRMLTRRRCRLTTNPSTIYLSIYMS